MTVLINVVTITKENISKTMQLKIGIFKQIIIIANLLSITLHAAIKKLLKVLLNISNIVQEQHDVDKEYMIYAGLRIRRFGDMWA